MRSRPVLPIWARALFALLLSLLPAAWAQSAAAHASNRQQVLRALAHADALGRREAALRLGKIGIMRDTPALLRALRDGDAQTRKNAERALWQIWGRSGDARVDRLYRRGIVQMERGELREGIATFSRVIALKPSFAEGWNKRATLYFLAGEYRKSLADCAQVIKRNPNHFGALVGYGQIYLRLSDYERSLEYFRRALAINPNMDGVRLDVQLLEQLIEDSRRNMV